MTETLWPTKPEIFALWPFAEEFADASLVGKRAWERLVTTVMCALRDKNG